MHPRRLLDPRLRLRPRRLALAAGADRRASSTPPGASAGGDFSTQVPDRGQRRVRRARARSSTRWPRQLEARLEELRRERARLQDAMRRIGEAVASNLDRDALLEIVVRTAVDGVGADGGPRDAARERAGRALSSARPRATSRAFRDGHPRRRGAALRVGQAGARRERRRPRALAHPLRARGRAERVLGLVSVARAGAAVLADERELFHYLAGQAARVDRERRPARDRPAPGGHRRADRPLQPPPLPGGVMAGGRARAALRAAARAW